MISDAFTLTIQASKMQQLASYTDVFNVAEVPDIICIKLPDSLPRDMQLIEILDLNHNQPIDFEDYVARDENRPWIDISKSILDITPGQHIYRMTFSKELFGLTATCWFSYIIQDTFVDTPYIYMDRTEPEPEPEPENPLEG